MKSVENIRKLMEEYFSGRISEKNMIKLSKYFNDSIENAKEEVKTIIVNETLGETFIKINNEAVRCFDRALKRIYESDIKDDDIKEEFDRLIKEELKNKLKILH